MSLLVGLDIGTSGGRCLVVDEEGQQVGVGSRLWSYRWEGPGMCELDPDQAFAALSAAARDALAGLDTSEIVGVGVASQRTGVVLLDENGVELYTGPNADGRGVASGMDLERAHGDRVYRTNGRLPVMLYLPARLGWFRAFGPHAAPKCPT